MAGKDSIEGAIHGMLDQYTGSFGLAALNLATGESISINEHEIFASASVIKTALMTEIFCQRDEGTLSLDEKIILKDEYKVGGSGVIKEMHEGLETTLLDLVNVMIVLSDNTATNMLIDRIGFDAVNERMKALGLKGTMFARKMYDWDAAANGRENRITAWDMTHLLHLMVDGRISSKSTSMEMLGIMARQQYRDRIPRLLPEGTKVANKTGSIRGSSHDVGVVYGPKATYILSVLTKGVSEVMPADTAIAEVSRLIYERFSS